MSTTNKSPNNAQHIHQEHAAELLQQLQLLLSAGENGGENGLCDVVLIAGKNGQRVPAHRVILAASSPYFRTMFTVKMRESTAAEVTEEDVHGDFLLPLVQFCYTGEIEICAETVDELARTAHRLQLNAVVSGCSKFMKRHLDASNCLGVAALAELLSLNDLKQSADKHAWESFVQVSQQDEFLQLNIEQLKVFIGSDELRVHSEKTVFHSVMSWVHYNKDESKRSQHIPALLTLVRLPLLPVSFLTKHVWTLCHEHSCMPLLKDAFAEANVPISNRSIKPRKSTQSNVLAVWGEGSSINIISLYSPVEDEWKFLAKSFPFRSWCSFAFFNDELIAVGAMVYGKLTNTVESINLDTMKLSKLPSMAQNRVRVRLAVLDGLLYAAGGSGDSGVVNRVEHYDPKECKWSDVAPMSVARKHFGLAVLDGRLFAVGGKNQNEASLNSTECYDPQTDKWTMLANLNIPRSELGSASGNGFLYAVGGYGDYVPNSLFLSPLKSIEQYDPQVNKWTEICQLSSPRSIVGCVFLDYCLSILSVDDGRTSLQEYNPVTDTWTQLATLFNRKLFNLHAVLK